MSIKISCFTSAFDSRVKGMRCGSVSHLSFPLFTSGCSFGAFWKWAFPVGYQEVELTTASASVVSWDRFKLKLQLSLSMNGIG